MVNKPKNQGTAWETAIVNRFKRIGFDADRLPLKGVKGEPDLYIEGFMAVREIPVVMWKRLVKAKGKKKRVPDGEKEVVIMSLDDFEYLIRGHDLVPRFMVQAKATQTLNVTRVLGQLRDALKLLT